IRKVTLDGIITTVAGNGISGFSGDGGSAFLAQLNDPRGVAVDRAGNFFIADTNNHRLRKVDSAGVIKTIAGTGTNGFAGDGASAAEAQLGYPSGVAVDAAGNLFIADSFNNRIRLVTIDGLIQTTALSAQTMNPNSVALDSAGNLFIA